MKRLLLLLPLALAGCGLREPLAPAQGQQMPPAPPGDIPADANASGDAPE